MELYTNKHNNAIEALKTKIVFEINSPDFSEMLEYKLPIPHKVQKKTNHNKFYNSINYMAITYIIDGFFGTRHGKKYFSDIIARFCLSMDVIDYNYERINTQTKGYKLKQFGNLKSMPSPLESHRSDGSNDEAFYAIKWNLEGILKGDGEGTIVPYYLIEDFALNKFPHKEKSTLKAKCRSVWYWYKERNWSIPRGKYVKKIHATQTRIQNAINNAKLNSDKSKIAVLDAVNVIQTNKLIMNLENIASIADVSSRTVAKYVNIKELKKKQTPPAPKKSKNYRNIIISTMIEIDKDQSIKMNISNISKIGGIHRKTVTKYIEFSDDKEKSGIFVKKVKNEIY